MTETRMNEIKNTASHIEEAVRDLQIVIVHYHDVAAQGTREEINNRLKSIANLAASLRRSEERDGAVLDPVTALHVQAVNGMNCLSVMLRRNVLRTACTDLTDDNELLKIRNMAEIVTSRLDHLLAARQGSRPAALPAGVEVA